MADTQGTSQTETNDMTKTTKEIQIAFRCDPQFRERCRKVAALDGRDLANWIRLVLAQEMDRVAARKAWLLSKPKDAAVP